MDTLQRFDVYHGKEMRLSSDGYYVAYTDYEELDELYCDALDRLVDLQVQYEHLASTIRRLAQST
jgi:hypothetical protein